MSVNQSLLEQVQFRQRLITDLLEEQSLTMVQYRRCVNAYPADDSALSEKEKMRVSETLKALRDEINEVSDRILKLQHEITTIIRGEV